MYDEYIDEDNTNDAYQHMVMYGEAYSHRLLPGLRRGEFWARVSEQLDRLLCELGLLLQLGI